MLAAEHQHLWSGNLDRALAQNVQNLKATTKALTQANNAHTHLARVGA